MKMARRTLVLFINVMFLVFFVCGVAYMESYDFFDDASDLSKYWSEPSNTDAIFIVDSKTATKEQSVPEGQYRFFGKPESNRYTAIYHEPSSISNEWTLEFSAKFVSLPDIDANEGWRGFNIQIFTGINKRYVIGFYNGTIAAVNGNENIIRPVSALAQPDDTFHKWKIVCSKGDTIVIFRDDKEVARFIRLSGLKSDLPIKIGIGCMPINITKGHIDVYIDSISFKDKKGL